MSKERTEAIKFALDVLKKQLIVLEENPKLNPIKLEKTKEAIEKGEALLGLMKLKGQ